MLSTLSSHTTTLPHQRVIDIDQITKDPPSQNGDSTFPKGTLESKASLKNTYPEEASVTADATHISSFERPTYLGQLKPPKTNPELRPSASVNSPANQLILETNQPDKTSRKYRLTQPLHPKHNKLKNIIRRWIRSRNDLQEPCVLVEADKVVVSGSSPPSATYQNYAALIGDAILRSPKRRRSAKGICRDIMKKCPRYNDNRHAGWQALISQELALNDCFEAISVRRKGRSTEAIKWQIARSKHDEILRAFHPHANPEMIPNTTPSLTASTIPHRPIDTPHNRSELPGWSRPHELLGESTTGPSQSTSPAIEFVDVIPPNESAVKLPYSWGLGFCSDDDCEVEFPIALGGIGARSFTEPITFQDAPGPSSIRRTPSHSGPSRCLKLQPVIDTCLVFRRNSRERASGLLDLDAFHDPFSWPFPIQKAKGKARLPETDEARDKPSNSSVRSADNNNQQNIRFHGQGSGDKGTRSSNQTSSTESGTQQASSATINQLPRLSNDESQYSDENEDGNTRKRKRFRYPEQAEGRRFFACPYHKFDPQKYGVNERRYLCCAGSKFEYISLLLRHLMRTHDEFVCGKCMHNFNSKPSFDQHSSICMTRLRCSQEELWANIWRARFPRTPIPKSPYFEGLVDRHLPSQHNIEEGGHERPSQPMESLAPVIANSDATSNEARFPVAESVRLKARIESIEAKLQAELKSKMEPFEKILPLVEKSSPPVLEARIESLEGQLPRIEKTVEQVLIMLVRLIMTEKPLNESEQVSRSVTPGRKRFAAFYFDKLFQIPNQPSSPTKPSTSPAAPGRYPDDSNWNTQTVLSGQELPHALEPSIGGLHSTDIFSKDPAGSLCDTHIDSFDSQFEEFLEKLPTNWAVKDGTASVNVSRDCAVDLSIPSPLVERDLEANNGFLDTDFPLDTMLMDTLSPELYPTNGSIYGP